MSAVRVMSFGFGCRWTEPHGGLWVLPLAAVQHEPGKHCGTHYHRSIDNAPLCTPTSRRPIATYCPPNGIAPFPKEVVGPIILSDLTTPYSNAAVRWSAKRFRSAATPTYTRSGYACLSIGIAMLYQFSLYHYPNADMRGDAPVAAVGAGLPPRAEAGAHDRRFWRRGRDRSRASGGGAAVPAPAGGVRCARCREMKLIANSTFGVRRLY
jgi:hypothetical protein